jgi:hypothetical protein
MDDRSIVIATAPLFPALSILRSSHACPARTVELSDLERHNRIKLPPATNGAPSTREVLANA